MTDPYAPQPVASRRPRWLIPVIAAAFLLLAVATWAGGYWWTHRSITIDGTLTLHSDTSLVHQGSACSGLGGYGDIKAGAQVVVSDGSGTTVALGALGAGNSTASYNDCVFPIHIEGVPAGSDFYGIEVGKRGRVQFTADQLGGVALTLGS